MANLSSSDVKTQARSLGFDACGISSAGPLDEEARRLEAWLNMGFHGTMTWMERNFEKRVDPTRLVPGARSVISVLHNYYQARPQPDQPGIGRISRYAWGKDYHKILKDKLYELFGWLDTSTSGIQGRVFVDSAPVMDKVWAARSGLGWIGKHTNLIRPGAGSWYFIGEIISDLELQPDVALADYCGSCTRCIQACPTNAIYRPYAVDANRCISYLTIEHRQDDIPSELERRSGDWIFGCDVCQEVCPWNKFSQRTREEAYLDNRTIRSRTLEQWQALDPPAFTRLFEESPIERAGHEGFQRSVRIALQNREIPAGDD